MKFILLSAFAVSLGLGTTAFAQGKAQQNPPSQQQQGGGEDQSQAAVITGCLTKGASAGQYVISDKSTGDKITFAASEKIEPYVNQTVQLTGKVADRGGDKVFQPQTVKRVADTCEGGGGGNNQ